MGSIITPDQVRDYMFQVYFGDYRDPFKAAVKRAYLDFNRTLHDFGTNERRQETYAQAEQRLITQLQSMLTDEIANQEQYDKWHRDCCDQLIETFRSVGQHKMYYGQAQKWINMALKYLFVLDRELTSRNYRYFHIPIDNIVLKKLASMNEPPVLTTAWSRLDSYEEYLKFQARYRSAFAGIPMDNEFTLWMK